MRLLEIVNYTKENGFSSEKAILSWLGFVLGASISQFSLKIVDNDIIKGKYVRFIRTCFWVSGSERENC